MQRLPLARFLDRCARTLGPGPAALVFAEDEIEIGSTLRWLDGLGFRRVAVFLPDRFGLPDDLPESVLAVRHAPRDPGFDRIVTAVARAVAPGTWLHYCFNAEYLFFPFCETRRVGEMLAFHAEEKRAAMLTFVVDLYARDLARAPCAVARDDALLDRTGYFALARPDPARDGAPKDRQLDFHGGLRWRFEEHVPADRRRIDRVSLFRARPGLELRPDHTLSEEEMNTYACPWHHNLTAAVASFRAAKALRANPGSRDEIASFAWANSTPFEWSSRQLMDLGLMEPGQWF